MSKKNISFEHFIDKIFKDKTGEIVIVQAPNLVAYFWIIVNILLLFVSGDFQKLLQILSFGLLFTWCWLEITEGTNYFRRALGTFVLVIAIINRLK